MSDEIRKKLVADGPKIVDTEQTSVYMPIGGTDTKGVNSYETVKDFNVINGKVSLKYPRRQMSVVNAPTTLYNADGYKDANFLFTDYQGTVEHLVPNATADITARGSIMVVRSTFDTATQQGSQSEVFFATTHGYDTNPYEAPAIFSRTLTYVNGQLQVGKWTNVAKSIYVDLNDAFEVYDSRLEAVETGLVTETAARIAGDANLQGQVTTNKASADATQSYAEYNRTLINNEIERATTAEGLKADKTYAEDTRSLLSQEVERATTAEGVNAGNIAAEILRATGAEETKVDKTSAPNALVEDLAFTSTASTAPVTITKRNIATGVQSTEALSLPFASATVSGVQTPDNYNQVLQNTSDIELLKGRSVRLVIHLGSVTNPTQEQLESAYETGYPTYPVPATDGTTLVDLDNNKEYTWFTSNNQWNDRGSTTVTPFTNNNPGIIQGKDADGYVAADNGFGAVTGWSALTSQVSGIDSTLTTVESNLNEALTQLSEQGGRIETLEIEVENNTSTVGLLELEKLDKDQGTSNAGKLMVVGTDGIVFPSSGLTEEARYEADFTVDTWIADGNNFKIEYPYSVHNVGLVGNNYIVSVRDTNGTHLDDATVDFETGMVTLKSVAKYAGKITISNGSAYANILDITPATSTTLGGILADAATSDDTVPVHIADDLKLYVNTNYKLDASTVIVGLHSMGHRNCDIYADVIGSTINDLTTVNPNWTSEFQIALDATTTKEVVFLTGAYYLTKRVVINRNDLTITCKLGKLTYAFSTYEEHEGMFSFSSNYSSIAFNVNVFFENFSSSAFPNGQILSFILITSDLYQLPDFTIDLTYVNKDNASISYSGPSFNIYVIDTYNFVLPSNVSPQFVRLGDVKITQKFSNYSSTEIYFHVLYTGVNDLAFSNLYVNIVGKTTRNYITPGAIQGDGDLTNSNVHIKYSTTTTACIFNLFNSYVTLEMPSTLPMGTKGYPLQIRLDNCALDATSCMNLSVYAFSSVINVNGTENYNVSSWYEMKNYYYLTGNSVINFNNNVNYYVTGTTTVANGFATVQSGDGGNVTINLNAVVNFRVTNKNVSNTYRANVLDLTATGSTLGTITIYDHSQVYLGSFDALYLSDDFSIGTANIQSEKLLPTITGILKTMTFQ